MADKKTANDRSKARVMPTPFGIRVDFAEATKLTEDDVRSALLDAVKAIPASKLKGFNNGRLTMIV